MAMFDSAGAHEPTHGNGDWSHTEHRLDDDGELLEALAGYGVVVRAPGDLPFA